MKKTFISTLLLIFINFIFGFIFGGIVDLFPALYSLWVILVHSMLIGVFFGAIYTSIYKMEIPKKDKIKTIVYFLFIMIILFFVSEIVLDFISLKTLLTLFTFIISTFLTYLGIDLGCKLALIILNKCKLIKHRN